MKFPIAEDVSAVYSDDSEDSSMSDDDHRARRLQKAKQLRDDSDEVISCFLRTFCISSSYFDIWHYFNI